MFSEIYKYAAYDGLQRLSGRQTLIGSQGRGDERGRRSVKIKGPSWKRRGQLDKLAGRQSASAMPGGPA
jgi:hypothetical protein